MMEFSGLDYLRIDIANNYGKDRITWNERLDWFHDNTKQLHLLVEEAKKPFLMYKGICNYKKAIKGLPIGHPMFMDATASGLQVMAALSGCHQTGIKVNMVDPTTRRDVYDETANVMNAELPIEERVTRAWIKKPLMIHWYNKIIQDTLTELQQKIFFKTMNTAFKGAQKVMDHCNLAWSCTSLMHEWILPDEHLARCLVTEMKNIKINVDELNTSFAYRYEKNTISWIGSSLAANIIHSIDAYVCREMIRRCKRMGIQLITIHDAFGTHPNFMNHVRRIYKEIFVEIAESNLFEDILLQLGLKGTFDKESTNLSDKIKESEYMLS